MRFEYQVGERVAVVEIERTDDGYRVTVDGRAHSVRAQPSADGAWALEVDGARRTVWVAADGLRVWAGRGSSVARLIRQVRRARRPGGASAEGALEASMPGQVRSVLVAEGEAVERGQTLVLLEAMKMEIRVAAPRAGRVIKMLVAAGDVVERGQRLVELGH